MKLQDFLDLLTRMSADRDTPVIAQDEHGVSYKVVNAIDAPHASPRPYVIIRLERA